MLKLFLIVIISSTLLACSTKPKWTNPEKGMRLFNQDNKACRASATRKIEHEQRKKKLQAPIFLKDEQATGRTASIGNNSAETNAIRTACLKRRGYVPIEP